MGTTACSYLGIGLRTLYKLIDDGEIRAYKIGRVIRLRKVDADADTFLDAHAIEPGTLGHLLPPFGLTDREGDDDTSAP